MSKVILVFYTWLVILASINASDNISCDFETNLCSWASPVDRFVRHSGRSPTANQSIPGAASGEWYALCNGHKKLPSPTDTCELSQDVIIDKDLMKIEFNYHLRGAYIERLDLMKDDMVLWSEQRLDTEVWRSAEVELPTGSYKLRFVGYRTNSNLKNPSDFGIDDIIYKDYTPDTTATEVPTTTTDRECQIGDKQQLFAECEWYQLCLDGKFAARRCPFDNKGLRQMFDPVINTCTENIKLPIQDKCNSYKKCLVIEDVSPFGKWTEKKCEFDDQHFDSNSQQCIDSTASTCETKSCKIDTCFNGGLCKETGTDDHNCLCPFGFTGSNCQYKNNPCSADSCLNGGTCFSDSTQSTQCFCKDGFGGENCEINNGYKLISTLKGHTDLVRSVAFNSDSTILASGSYDNTVKLWNTDTGDLLRTLNDHNGLVQSVAFDNNYILASGSGDKSIKLWDVMTGQLLRTLKGHTSDVSSVEFVSDSKLASGSYDNTIKIWNTLTGELLITINGHAEWVRDIAFDGDNMLASASSDKTVMLWDVNYGGLLKTLAGHADAVLSVAFSADKARLASGSYKSVHVWNPNTGELLMNLGAHSNWVNSLVWSAADRLVSGSTDTTVKVWNIKSSAGAVEYALEVSLQGHTKSVQSVAVGFRVSGETVLASGSEDRTIKLWTD